MGDELGPISGQGMAGLVPAGRVIPEDQIKSVIGDAVQKKGEGSLTRLVFQLKNNQVLKQNPEYATKLRLRVTEYAILDTDGPHKKEVVSYLLKEFGNKESMSAEAQEKVKELECETRDIKKVPMPLTRTPAKTDFVRKGSLPQPSVAKTKTHFWRDLVKNPMPSLRKIQNRLLALFFNIGRIKKPVADIEMQPVGKPSSVLSPVTIKPKQSEFVPPTKEELESLDAARIVLMHYAKGEFVYQDPVEKGGKFHLSGLKEREIVAKKDDAIRAFETLISVITKKGNEGQVQNLEKQRKALWAESRSIEGLSPEKEMPPLGDPIFARIDERLSLLNHLNASMGREYANRWVLSEKTELLANLRESSDQLFDDLMKDVEHIKEKGTPAEKVALLQRMNEMSKETWFDSASDASRKKQFSQIYGDLAQSIFSGSNLSSLSLEEKTTLVLQMNKMRNLPLFKAVTANNKDLKKLFDGAYQNAVESLIGAFDPQKTKEKGKVSDSLKQLMEDEDFTSSLTRAQKTKIQKISEDLSSKPEEKIKEATKQEEVTQVASVEKKADIAESSLTELANIAKEFESLADAVKLIDTSVDFNGKIKDGTDMKGLMEKLGANEGRCDSLFKLMETKYPAIFGDEADTKGGKRELYEKRREEALGAYSRAKQACNGSKFDFAVMTLLEVGNSAAEAAYKAKEQAYKDAMK